jgi:hypothetical protein
MLASAYLVVYCFLLASKGTMAAGMLMFVLSPVMIVAMVYSVLRFGQYKGRELDDHEYGYGDKENDELGVF